MVICVLEFLHLTSPILGPLSDRAGIKEHLLHFLPIFQIFKILCFSKFMTIKIVE
jgi:hypothetical protein